MPIPAHVTKIVERWDEAKKYHDPWVRLYERRERAYRGILQMPQKHDWRHHYHPKYAFNLIETIVSNTVEMGLRFNVRPAPKVNTPLDEAMHMLDQAEAVSDLLRHEHRVDEMDWKQRPLFLSAAIGGTGVLKSWWNYTEGSVRKQAMSSKPVYGPDGEVLMHVPTLGETQSDTVLHDNSTSEVVDPRDFVMHPAARDLQPWKPGGAQYCFHRCWYSYEQLKAWERSGFLKNVDEVKESRDYSSEYADRETEVWQDGRMKNLIEVLEYWCFEDGHVKRTFVGNRAVELREQETSPYWHGGYPFMLCSSMPQPFSTRGVSDVELVEHLQEILWEMQNQTLDNLELINNFVTLIREDVDDPDAFELYPGARWSATPDQVQALLPPYQLANITAEREALVKGDLQNVTSAAPFAGGADTATVDNKTATGASIVMNAAQKRLVAKKFEAQRALILEANMRIKNCQQFVTDKRLVHIVGMDGKDLFRELEPTDIQGEFFAELELMGESEMRQERRAEWTQLTQVLLQAAPLAAAAGVPLNVKELLTVYLKRGWQIEDAERFFSEMPAAGGAVAMGGGQGQGQGGGGQAPAAQGAPNLGVTAESAVDASSPSARSGMSASPVVALQRALAMGGGANNV